MPILSDYVRGTLSVTNGSAAFTGTNTGWQLAGFKEGDTIIDVTGATEYMGVVATIDANGAGTLTKPWEGPTLVNAEYRMRYQPDGARVSAQARSLIELLGNGNVQALAGLPGSANQVPIFTGPGAMTLVSKTDLVSGAAYDVQVDDLTARAAYDGQSQGYAVLVANTGDGRSAIYSKNSNSAGDWSSPAYVTGPVGPIVAIEAGETATLPPGSDATVTISPVSGGYELDFGIPEGRGAKYAGVYDAGTSYVLDNAVLDNGSTWVLTAASSTGNAPPVLPVTSNAWWALLARAGIDGTGTGDVVGPAGSVADRLAVFSGTTGKLLKDGGKTIAELGIHINVKSQGAVGDGNADDTAAFQAALDLAKTTGQAVFVPAGRYKISTTLLFDRSADASPSAGLVLLGEGMYRSVLVNTIAVGGPTLDLTTGGSSKYQIGGLIEGIGFEHSGSGAGSHGIRYRSCWHQSFRALRFTDLNGAGLKVINTTNDADASSQVMIDDIYAVGLQGAAWDSAGSTGGVALHTIRHLNAVSCSKTFGNAYVIIDGVIQFSMEMCSLSGGAADNVRPLVSLRSTNVRARQIEIRGGEYGNNSGTHFEIEAVSNFEVNGIRQVRRASEANSQIGFDFPDGTDLYSGIRITNIELQIDDATPVWTWIKMGTGLSSAGTFEVDLPNISSFATGNVLRSYTSGAKQKTISSIRDAAGAEVLSPPLKRQRVTHGVVGNITPDLTEGQWYQALLTVSGAFTVQTPTGGQVDGRRMVITIFKDGTNTISWAAGYEAPTVPTNGGTFEFLYDGASSMWRLIQ